MPLPPIAQTGARRCDDDEANDERRLRVHCILRDGLVHDALIEDAPGDGGDDNNNRRGGRKPSSPTRSTTTSRRWRTTACCAWGVALSTSTNADADAGTTPMPSPPPHRCKHPISIPQPRPHHTVARGRGGRIRDRLRGADPRGDIIRGGLHGDRPNLVRGCGADRMRRG